MWWMGVLLVAWAGPEDRAFDALVDGKEGRALQVLRSALDEDEDGSVRCLLGEVALQVGRTSEALSVLEDVPEDAPCAGRAAFVQAEALRVSGDLPSAAARYEALTDALMEPSTQPLSIRLEAWAERLLAEEPPNTPTAASLLAIATRLEAEGSERRLQLARTLADLRPGGDARSLAVAELSRAVAGSNGPAAEDRRRLARLVDVQSAVALLQLLPDDAPTMATRQQVVPASDLAQRYALAQELLEAHPTSEEAAEVRSELGLLLAASGWLSEARALLTPLVAAEGDGAREASWALVRLAVRAGDDDALDQLDALIARYPTAALRSEAETLRDELILDRLRSEARDGRFDGAAWDAASTTAALALEAAWATEDEEERADRMDALVARWPNHPEAREALRYRALHHPDGLEWLRARQDRGPAYQVLQDLTEPEIGIRTAGEGEAEVELLTRGLDAVELRLHRIDVEGWLRAGGAPDALGDLDVAIVAPDRTWTVEVPEEGPEVRFTTPVEVPGPGLYAVTAATSDREARTLLMVSDTRGVARAQGPDLAMAAFRDGKPTASARFWVRAGGQVSEVRPGRDGLARATVASGPAVVVAETAGGPTILEVGGSFAAAVDGLWTSVDLDRPVYRPGDVLRFRAVGARAGEPVSGDWRVSLVGSSGTVYQALPLTADRAGAVTGTLVVPWTSTGRQDQGAAREQLRLLALPPGSDAEVQLATVAVIDEVPTARRLAVEPEGDDVRIVVRDGDGVPVVDQPVTVAIDGGSETIRRTDRAGSIPLESPPAGVAWTVSAALPGDADSRRSFVRPAPEAAEQRLRLDDPRAQPGEPVRVVLEGEGESLLRVVRLLPRRVRPAPMEAPEPFTPPGLTVYQREQTRAWQPDLHQTVSTQTVSLSEGELTLPGLDEGRYRLELIRADGRAATRTVELEVRPGTRIRLADAPLVGRSVSVDVDGGWTLLTAEGGRMLDAQLVPPGRSRSLEVDRAWHGQVQLVATGIDDQHERSVEVDAALEVTLDAQRAGARWSVSGRVTDAAGNPQRAQVVVRAVDQLLIDENGTPPTLSDGLLRGGPRWSAETARGLALRHGGWAEALAAELLAEVRREADARRKRLASEGRLSESKVAEVLDADVPLGIGGVGAGGGGYGAGGGGFGGKGRSGVGVRAGRGQVLGSRGFTLYGTRSVGLWRVVTTDRDGRYALDVAAPDRRRTWRVDAVAVVPSSVGRASTTVEPAPLPWVAVDALRPGWPGDVAKPRAQMVNPSSAEQTVQLRAGDVGVERTLAPGEVVEVPLGALEAGARQDVVLTLDGQTVDRRDVAFPLAEGAPGDGDLHVSVTGVEGGTVLGALALMHDPRAVDEPHHAIAAARAALAALPHLTEPEQTEAMRRIWAGVAVARDRIGGLALRDGPQALRLVAEAAPVLGLPQHTVDAVAEALQGEPVTPQQRVEQAFARAVADAPVQEATVGRLLRDAEHLDEEGRGMLARLLDRLGAKASLEAGQGVQWDLYALERRRRIDREVTLRRPPPPLGDPARADWVRAVAIALRDTPGTATRGPGWARGRQARPAPLAWSEAPPSGDDVAGAHRWPAGLAGRLANVTSPARGREGEEALRCGARERPCRVAVGEGLSSRSDVEPSGGLRTTARGQLIYAATPGAFTLWSPSSEGFRALHVEVVADATELTPLGQGEVLAIAAQREQVGETFAELLADRPSLEDWYARLRGRAAHLRFAATSPDDAQAWIAAFEDLRDEVPTASVDPDDVVHTARAYQRLGRHDRAIQVYERAIGQAFLAEAAVVTDVGDLVGPLAGLQALRELTLRYPAVPVVRQSEFALPDRLLGLVGNIPEKARERGVTDTELQLMAADWDRRFVALAGDSPLAPEAGLRLATGLTDLGARSRALSWVQRLRQAHPDHALTDRWMLLESLLLTELDRPQQANGLLQDLSEELMPLGGGRYAPSALRDDARLALARLAEAEKRWDAAAERYRQVQGTFPEASLAASALTEVQLRLDEPLVRGPVAQTSRLQVRATNVDEVQVRAYAIDLRTLFLRDGGLPDPGAVRIDGLRPTWSGTRPVAAGPFPQARTLDLPLQGPGVWLVRLDADGASSLAWVLRSDLQVHHSDQGNMRRLSARFRDQPVAEAQVRATGSAGIVAETTDIRGVAMVGRGAGALLQLGPHVALTSDLRPGSTAGSAGSPLPAQPSLMDRVKGREEQRRRKRRDQYDYIGTEAAPAIEASTL